MRLSGQFQACLFFLSKDFERIKMRQQSKNRQTKNNKGNNFPRTKTSKEGKIGVFFAFFSI